MLQVRVVSSELTMTFLVRLTFTNWARHVHIKIQILLLPTTSTIFVTDDDVEFVACFVCCVVNIVQHIICIAIPDEIRKPACSEVQLSALTLRLLMSYIYGAPSKARNANIVYIWTYVWQR